MNQQPNIAASTASDLVQGIARALFGEAGAGITDLITLANFVQAGDGNLGAQPAELAEQQGVEKWIGEDGPEYVWIFLDAATNVTGYSETGPDLTRPGERAVKFVRATTGEQHVGEMQRDGLAPLPHTDYTAFSEGSEPLFTAKQMRDYAIAARQPGAQADEAAILRRGAAVLDMWEGDPNVTGHMGDFKDACAILEVLALHAATPAQGIDLGADIKDYENGSRT